ncbi:MAG: peptidase [Methanobacteriaceae archaeon]
MKDTKDFLAKIGINDSVNHSMDYVNNVSNHKNTKNTFDTANNNISNNISRTFSDGGHYRFEIPGIQNPTALECVISACDDYELDIHRVTQTKGIMLLDDCEIEAMVDLAKSNSLELFLSVGPRATYDTSASAQTKEGSKMGYRLRGYDNIVYAIEDVKRAVALGVRGILLYDEGLLFVLNKMRMEGELPKDIHFKVSAHMGHGNPASALMLQELGANSINPVRDLQINMLSSLRQTISIPLDIHTENPKSSGGFIRHYEVPDIIKVASPVYLKTGGSVAKSHNWNTSDIEAKQRVKQVHLVNSIIERYCDGIKASKK